MRQTLVRRPGPRATLVMFALAGLLTAGAGSASAATLQVCPSCAFTTIADALVAASNGDKIRIAAGAYGGNLTIAKNVSLLGAGAGLTTISGDGTASVVTVAAGTSA